MKTLEDHFVRYLTSIFKTHKHSKTSLKNRLKRRKDIKHNDTQHKGLNCNDEHKNDTRHYIMLSAAFFCFCELCSAKCFYAECHGDIWNWLKFNNKLFWDVFENICQCFSWICSSSQNAEMCLNLFSNKNNVKNACFHSVAQCHKTLRVIRTSCDELLPFL
jgi:hypothetical protein